MEKSLIISPQRKANENHNEILATPTGMAIIKKTAASVKEEDVEKDVTWYGHLGKQFDSFLKS